MKPELVFALPSCTEKQQTHNTIFLKKTADLIAISFSTKRIILSEKMKVSANNETNLL